MKIKLQARKLECGLREIPDDGFARLGEGDLPHRFQIPRAPQPARSTARRGCGVKRVRPVKVAGGQKVWRPGSPDHAVLQASGDHVDGNALRLVGEGHRADDLPAVHVADQVAVHRPQPQVAASAHWDAH